MTTFALIHGAGGDGWTWHLVEAELRARGHATIAPDLPIEDDAATLNVYADTVVRAIDSATGDDLVVVGISFGGYIAPIVCDRLPVAHLVLVTAMVPRPGETAGEMFAATGYAPEPQADPSPMSMFLHDVDQTLAIEALARGRDQSGTTLEEPWPLASWPDVPVTFVLARNDRLFPADWVRSVAAARLGVVPIEIESGHCVPLAQPRALADILEGVLTPRSPRPVQV